MAERIVKRKQAQEGEQVRLEARVPADVLNGAAIAKTALGSSMAEGAAAHGAAQAAAKADSQHDRAHAAASAFLSKAHAEAQAILAQAQSQAAEIHSAALAEIEKLKQATQQELARERQALEKETQAKLESEYRERFLVAIKTLEAAAADLAAKRDEYLAGIELPAFELILALTRQIMFSELNLAPEALAPVIAQALSLLKPDSPLALEVHPSVFQRLTLDDSLQQALVAAGIKPALVELATGDGLAPGQFIARLNGASLSYDLEQAITAAAELFVQRARHFSPEAAP